MKIRLLLLIFTVFCSSIVLHADQPRYKFVFTSANKKFELTWQSAWWSLKGKEKDTEIYRLTENVKSLSSMTVLISDDGKTVVAVDDYSVQNFLRDPEVLIFYKGGKKNRAYTLSELLSNINFVGVSVSHFSWIDRYRNFLIFKNSSLSLTTLELTTYRFNTETGEILTKEKDELLADDAAYVSGFVRWLGGKKYEIRVECVVYGSIAAGSIVPFESDRKMTSKKGESYRLLILRKGKPALERGLGFNACGKWE